MRSDADPVLEIRSLRAGYHGLPVVWDLNLTLRAGEVAALLGANGSGKTTTLLTASGLLAPITGTVELLGAPVSVRRAYENARRGLAHVPEDRALFSGLSASRNISLASRGDAEAFERAVSYFPALRPLLGRRAGLLSGGEQQMLALARALAGRPRVLFVDELSMGLAPIVVEQLLPVLRAIANDSGLAILLVEQHVEMALEVADHACVLSRGRVVIEGPAAQLAKRRDLIEASYLGSWAGP